MKTAFVGIMLLISITSTAQQLDPSCLQGIDIAPNKVTATPWAPDGAPVKPMRCQDLEAARTALFVDKVSKIDPAGYKSVAAYETELNDVSRRAQDAVSALNDQLKKDRDANTLGTAVKIARLAIGKYITLIECVEPAVVTPPGAFVCAFGIYEYFSNLVELGDASKAQVSAEAAKLTEQMKELAAKKAKLLARKPTFDISLNEKRTVAMFNGMCAAVKKDCKK